MKFLKYKVSLIKINDKNYELIFTCDSNNDQKSRIININDEHKFSPIGNICQKLYLGNHREWFVEKGETSSLYSYDQPDLMLEGQLDDMNKKII